jgi:hypothetical protein
MGDTVKIRQLRPGQVPGQRPGKDVEPEAAARGGLDRVVEEVKLALMTTGLTLEGEKGRGLDPYNSKPVAKHDAWSDRHRRR